MIFNPVLAMEELSIEFEQASDQNDEEEDGDSCDIEEINHLFTSCTFTSEVVVPDQYVLQIAASSESGPNVGFTTSSNSCKVFSLNNNQFREVAELSEHTDVISEIKFSKENGNVLYTCSNDGCLKVWDLRSPKKNCSEFKDTTVTEKNRVKPLNCFDISQNNRLIAAGTNLMEGDAFILFWDIRKSSLLGGYWESHTDDVTQVKFHGHDPNKLASGSVDGLINLYDLSQASEDDALVDCLNTESSVEKLNWLRTGKDDEISCITHTAEVQYWKVNDAKPYLQFSRSDVADAMKRKSENHVYVVNIHEGLNRNFMLVGSNANDGECFRGLSVVDNSLQPCMGFPKNFQRVRTSCYIPNEKLLLTGGEKGALQAWIVPNKHSSFYTPPIKKKKLDIDGRWD